MIIIVDNNTGALHSAYHGESIKQEEYGFPYSCTKLYTHLKIPEHFDPYTVRAVRDSAGNWRVEQDVDKLREQQRLVWGAVRAKRDQLLAQTDYLLLPDYPMSKDNMPAVLKYRQDLRDVPATFDSPDTIVWPRRPAFLPSA